MCNGGSGLVNLKFVGLSTERGFFFFKRVGREGRKVVLSHFLHLCTDLQSDGVSLVQPYAHVQRKCHEVETKNDKRTNTRGEKKGGTLAVFITNEMMIENPAK